MIKRKWMTIGLMLALTAGGTFLAIIVIRSYRDPLAIAAERIQVGMSENEAKEIIGRPANSGGFAFEGKGDPDKWWNFNEWYGDEPGSKLRLLSRDGLVVSKEFGDGHETILNRLTKWVHLD